MEHDTSSSSSSAESQLEPSVHGGGQPELQNANHPGDGVGFLHSFPAGFRFAPRDDELLEAYLSNKVLGLPMPVNSIPEVNIYHYNPQVLTASFQPLDDNGREWYFFTPRRRKYPNGSRPDRTSGDGYWKATGPDIEVKHRITGEPLGSKRALVFYGGRPPRAVKSNWIMDEYKLRNVIPRTNWLDTSDMKLDECTLVRIYEKAARGPKENEKATKAQKEEVNFNMEATPDAVEDDILPKSNPSNITDEEGGKQDMPEMFTYMQGRPQGK